MSNEERKKANVFFFFIIFILEKEGTYPNFLFDFSENEIQ